MAPRGAGRAWLAVLAAAAACCHAQLASAGAKRIPPVDAETEVGMGGWASLGWKVGTSHADVLRLGDKFQLSGVGDSVKDDDWLRLFDVGNRGFYGGFAAGKLWGKELIGNSLQIGNKWQVSESPDGDWLRLTAAGSGAQLGGLAVGKMKANSLLVEGSTQTNDLQISKQFLLSPDKAWLRLVDPLTKKTHTSGGLQFGNAKAESVQSNGVHVAKTLRLGDKWKLNVEGGTTASDDEYLRLTGLDGKTLHGGVASAKMSTEQLEVGHSATFKGTTTMEGDATFKGKVVFDKVATMGSTITSLSQIGNMILSNVDAKTQASDGLHVYQADGKTYGSVVSGEMKSATTSTALLQLGNKWRLSGTGDKFHDDDWLRLMNIDNTGYYGGLAVKKLWTPKAFNHVLQLGTKWRLSGVGDKMQDDDWLRLMDIQNTKLYGGFAAAKMQTQNMEVKGLARVKYLEVASRYRLVGTLDTLQVKNDKDNALAKLQASHLKSDTLNVLRSGLLNSVHVTKTASVNRLEAAASVEIAQYKFESDSSLGTAQGNNWLKLTHGPAHSKMGNLHFGNAKVADLTSSGTATLATASAETLSATTANVKELKVTGKIKVTEGIWVGGQRITPMMPTALEEEVRALKQELAAMKLLLSEMQTKS